MATNLYIQGETMVMVKGGEHCSGGPISTRSDLGLSVGPVVMSPKFYHKEIKTDDFGPTAPVEIQWNLASVDISMTLVHFDADVLNICWSESMGGVRQEIVIPRVPPLQTFPAGMMVGAGSTLGHGLPMFASGCHYISLSLAAPQYPQNGIPWRFRTCYLTAPPMEFPFGTERSLVKLNWRAIPYRPLYQRNSGGSANDPANIMIEGNVYSPTPIYSSGVILWDHKIDAIEEDFPGDGSDPIGGLA